MKPLELYIKGIFNFFLMSAPWFMDFVDPIIKLVATVVGIILTVFLIKKTLIETEISKEKRREQKILNDIKEQELWAKIEANRKKS
jgi:hypothetical protein